MCVRAKCFDDGIDNDDVCGIVVALFACLFVHLLFLHSEFLCLHVNGEVNLIRCEHSNQTEHMHINNSLQLETV